MKKSLIALLFLGLVYPFQASAQTKSINKFIQKHKSLDGAQKIGIPGWLIDVGAGIGRLAVESEEEKALLKMAKKINKIKILSVATEEEIKKKDLNKLYKGLEKEAFEKMISVRDGESRFNMMVREKRGLLKNFILVAHDEGEFALISIKTSLSMEMLNALIRKLSDDFDIEMELPEEILQDEEEKIQV